MGLVPFVLAASVSGCPKKTDDEITVGAYLSLSGADSTFGIDTREGIELAVTQVNAKGGVKGKKIRVLYEDTKSTTQESSQKVMQLVDRDRVVAILGEAASGRSLAGGLVANTKGVPMITPSATAVEVTKDREWVFRACFTDAQQGRGAARLVRTQLKRQRVAVFYAAQNTYSSGLAKTFIETLRALGGDVVLEKAYPNGETSYRTYLAAIRDAKPDAIFVPNYYSEMVLVARQAKELGIPGNLFVGGDAWDSTNLLEGAGVELEGAYFTNHYAPDVPWPNAKAFLGAFEARFHKAPSGGAAQGYDAANMLFEAMTRAPQIERRAIRDALATTKGLQGATGTMTVDADRNVEKPIVVVQIREKQFRYAGEVEP